MNAREFVLALGDQLTEQGREVQVDEDGNMIRIFAPSRNIVETTVAAGAYKSSVTNRWTFLGARAYPLLGETRVGRTRRHARTLLTVYGTSYPRKAAA